MSEAQPESAAHSAADSAAECARAAAPRRDRRCGPLRTMLMKLVAAGTRMPAWVDAGFADYADRLRGDYRLELAEVPLGRRSRSPSSSGSGRR